jgi:hypothetical protein
MEIAAVFMPKRIGQRRQQCHIIHHDGKISGNRGEETGCQNDKDEQTDSHDQIDLGQPLDAGIHNKHHRYQSVSGNADDQQHSDGRAWLNTKDFVEAGSNLTGTKAKRQANSGINRRPLKPPVMDGANNADIFILSDVDAKRICRPAL